MSNLTPRINRLDRNYLINSAKDFAQRSTSAVNLGVSYAFNSLDRHVYKYAGSFSGTPTVQRIQDSPSGKTKYCSSLVANFSAVSAELFESQPIESVNARDLVGEQVSFSIWVKPDSCQTMELRLYTANVEDNFSAVTVFHSSSKVITPNSTWQRVTFENISVAAGAERGVLVEVVLTDSDSTGVSETHRLTRGKLNIGSTAQDWNLFGLDYEDEEEKCLRYYEKSYNRDVNPGTNTSSGIWNYRSGSGGTGFGKPGAPFIVKKRALPTMLAYAIDGTSGAYTRVHDAAGTGTSNTVTPLTLSASTSYVTTHSGNPGATNEGVAYHWTSDAEVNI